MAGLVPRVVQWCRYGGNSSRGGRSQIGKRGGSIPETDEGNDGHSMHLTKVNLLETETLIYNEKRKRKEEKTATGSFWGISQLFNLWTFGSRNIRLLFLA